MKKFSKRDHEKDLSCELINYLKLPYIFERMGNDTNEPDVIFCEGDKTVGIEICLAYYDDSDARSEWTLARGEREFPEIGYEFRAAGVIIEPDNLICSRVQAELNDKCSKEYYGVDEVNLCIQARAPLADNKSMMACISKISVPSENKFRHIWLAWLAPVHDGGGFQVREIT